MITAALLFVMIIGAGITGWSLATNANHRRIKGLEDALTARRVLTDEVVGNPGKAVHLAAGDTLKVTDPTSRMSIKLLAHSSASMELLP